MGVSNVIWFDVFTQVQAETQGIAVTVVHGAIVSVNACFIFSTDRVSRR